MSPRGLYCWICFPVLRILGYGQISMTGISKADQDKVRRQELSNFLRTRRERVSPADVGLAVTQRRRTAGLLREEVAQLAGISVTWYTWLEQRRPISTSEKTLDSLAHVLQLDGVERKQLFKLALRRSNKLVVPQRETVTPLLLRMLKHNAMMPAFVMGRRWDVLAWNDAARTFFSISNKYLKPNVT